MSKWCISCDGILLPGEYKDYFDAREEVRKLKSRDLLGSLYKILRKNENI